MDKFTTIQIIALLMVLTLWGYALLRNLYALWYVKVSNKRFSLEMSDLFLFVGPLVLFSNWDKLFN